jgi:putative hydrolase of the HAD superfamily
MTIRAVLFDLGGTLLHYHDPEHNDPQRPFYRVTMLGVRGVVDRLAAEGVAVPGFDQVAAATDKHIGQVFRSLMAENGGGSIETPIRSALAELGVPLNDQAWSALRTTFYAPINQIVAPRLGLRETLDALQTAGYVLGLISNSFWAADVHDGHLADEGLLDSLPVRIYSCEFGRSKPDPSIFQAALERLAVPAAESVYVGDRPDADVGGAQAAGLRGILIHSPHEESPLGGVLPDATIDELPELPAALQKLDETQP